MWRSNDLSAAATATDSLPAGEDLAAFAFEKNDSQHVAYRGFDDHIHELWWQIGGRGWQHNDLTIAAKATAFPPAGDPAAYAFEKHRSQHVVYRGTDGHIHELWWRGSGGDGWRHNDLSAAASATATALLPVGNRLAAYAFEKDDSQHVLYRATDGRIHELWWRPDGKDWWHNDLSAAAGATATDFLPAGDQLAAYAFEKDDSQHVIYRGTDDHIHELWWRIGRRGWQHNDLTAAASTTAFPPAGDPAAYVFEKRRSQHVVYRGTDDHIHELWWRGRGEGWRHNDLSAASATATAPLPAGYRLVPYAFEKDESQHVLYRGRDGHIHELWRRKDGRGWWHNDLNAAATPTAFRPSSNVAAYAFGSNLSQHVVYRGTDAHIHELWWRMAPRPRERSWWEKFGEGITDVADAVAGAVEDGVNAVAEVVGDVVETIGNAIEDALTAIGDLLGSIPLVGGALRRFFHWLGDVISGTLDLLATTIKGVLEAAAGIVAGTIRIVFGGIGGLIAWDASLFLNGIGDILSGVAGGALVILGKFAALVQQVFTVGGKRPLTDNETAILERVFRGSVAFYNVRIVEGSAGLFSLNDNPFVLGNTIYMKDHDPSAEPELLVHECVHVWQYQNQGIRYSTDALWAQWTIDDPYPWQDELARGNVEWVDFNGEAQAEFFEDLFTDGSLAIAPSIEADNGIFFDEDPLSPDVQFVFDGTDYTRLARRTVTFVRGTRSWRLSGLI